MKYRKVMPAIWNDAKFKGLDDNAKLVFFLLLTHPGMTALGAMRCTLHSLAVELKWRIAKTKRAFQQIRIAGLVHYDEHDGVMWLPNFLRYNGPESPNVVKAWQGAFDLLPEGKTRDAIIENAQVHVQGFGEGFRKAFADVLSEASRETMPNPEQEQEPEPKPKQEKSKRFALPDWIPADTWEQFEQMRQRSHRPMTDPARLLVVEKLGLLRADGHETRGVLEQSIRNGYPDVYEIKPMSTSANGVPAEWWKSQSGLRAKGAQLGMPLPDDEEYMHPYGLQVVKAAGPGEWRHSPEWSRFLTPEQNDTEREVETTARTNA